MEQNNALTGQGVEPETHQVLDKQPEERQNAENSSMETLLEEQGLDFDMPKEGEVRSGMIATLGENEILVSVGTKSEGVISGRELEQIPSDERAAFHVGMEIPVYVITPEDSNGNVVLSYVRAREEKDWQDAEKLLADAEPFSSKIIGYNKGGLLVPLGQLRGFIPASQISLIRRATLGGDTPDQRWGKMVGEPIKCRVIEVDRERRRLILSERAALQETRESLKDRLLGELKEGDVRTGRVTSVADFGAFVNIDGADGLVHLSEISWERINHPNEVLKVGQEVQVRVISIDQERRRIGLSIRQLEEDPWTRKVKGLREGQLVEGTITHLTKFGAFARLDEDLEGLIHISELDEHRINHPKEVVKEGDVVTLRVIKVDPERRRIGLSRRKVDSPAYSDLDWKMALSEEVHDVHAEEEPTPADVQAYHEEIAQETAVEAPAEQPPVEPPAQALAEVPPDEPMAEAPAEEPLAEEPPAEALAEVPPDEPLAEAPAEEPLAEEPPAEALAEVPPDEPLAETPAEDTPDEPPAESEATE
jgi:small subunit ribosomal protein S1